MILFLQYTRAAFQLTLLSGKRHVHQTHYPFKIQEQQQQNHDEIKEEARETGSATHIFR